MQCQWANLLCHPEKNHNPKNVRLYPSEASLKISKTLNHKTTAKDLPKAQKKTQFTSITMDYKIGSKGTERKFHDFHVIKFQS